ncbi:MAG TPA: tetratricopeptide repeat protein [Terriglobales bacterium]|nr:tetratricopeptide repeat protein [Terriglobales bacterium]
MPGVTGFFGFGIILQAVAILHFIRRRPDTYWLWIIIFGSGLGAFIYICVEVVPEAGMLARTFQVFPRRSRIRRLEMLILDNPSAGNYEELADLYFEDGKYARAREGYDRAISTRTDSPDPFYRRALCELKLEDYTAAVADLQHVIAKDPRYDYSRAAGLLGHALAKAGQPEAAATAFERVVQTSTLSETLVNYAEFLKSQGREHEARDWAQRVLSRKRTLPRYLKRRERPWFRKAAALAK